MKQEQLELSEEQGEGWLLKFRRADGSAVCVGWRNGEARDVTLPCVWDGGVNMMGAAIDGNGQHASLGPDPVYLRVR